MKTLFTFMLTLWALYCHGQSNSSSFNWHNPQYKSVKAYLYNLDSHSGEPVIIDGSLNATVVDTQGIALTDSQIIRVVGVVTGKIEGRSDLENFCYDPHHGIVFYDNDDKPVGYVSICFGCGQKEMYPPVDSPSRGLSILKEVLLEAGLPVFLRPSEYATYKQKLREEP